MSKLRNIFDKLRRIDKLINMRATGTPKQLAAKMGISERHLYNYLNIMKNDLDIPIKYNKLSQSYIYKVHGDLKIKWEKRPTASNYDKQEEYLKN